MQLQQVVYIYPDIALAVSFLMNGLILWGTARITKLTTGWPRIMAGTLTGAVYSFAAAFPQLPLLHVFWVKLMASVILVAVVFAPLNFRRFFSALVVFYVTSFTLGGLFLGVLYFIQTNGIYDDLSSLSHLAAGYLMPGLLITALIYVLVTKYAGSVMQKRLVQNMFKLPVKVMFGEAEIQVVGLIDTGNQLLEPLTRTPVVVIEYEVLKQLFPDNLRSVLEQSRDPDLMGVLNSLAETPWVTRFRIIPFSSLGRENGMLIGFRPDSLEVFNGTRSVCTKNVIIGVYRQELSPEGAYRALLHPGVIEGLTA